MKPWREVCVPHPDVLEGTFQQSEFAADLSVVHAGRATREYGDAAAFYQRTYITEGMRLLLTQVAQRLNGKGGEPVIQLQTAFGGGKTHTMLAVYHLAKRTADLKDLAGIPGLLDRAGLMDVPRARVVVLDGTERGPAKPWFHGKTEVRTLWGELAWQLGGEEGVALVSEADQTGTSPGKEALRVLLERFAPCVVLVDELVAYVRAFREGEKFSGGTYDSNLSFVQALTEAVKQVPTAMVLASLPESEIEAGSDRGVATLRALEKVFGRIQALWKPVAAEEAFEIVRRRLFESVKDPKERDEVCLAFARAYQKEGAKLPSETQEARYQRRMEQAYPIHPEIFDRLYGDWSTLDGFQRTRGVLKLMAQVIYRLWQNHNQDLMILPGSLPLADSNVRNNLVSCLPNSGWDAVLERDIDGSGAETTTIDTKETRFGEVKAAQRVARTIFLATAPSSGNPRAASGARGVERARVLLGCLQPGQSSAVYSDALNRLHDRLHYLNSSGDKEQDTTRYWFDVRANLRREMEDRKSQFEERGEVRKKIAAVLKKLTSGGSASFEGIHIFTASGDIPDDGALRLIFLLPEQSYSKADPQPASDALLEILQKHGNKARFRVNRLLFVAADQGALLRLRDTVRTALAWASIVSDISEGRLNIDRLQDQKAKGELEAAEGAVQRSARECFRWVLCPTAEPTAREPSIEVFPIPNSQRGYVSEIDQLCKENDLVIAEWAPEHLGTILRDLYWKGASAVRLGVVWEDMLRYLYLPRLKQRDTLDQVVLRGAASTSYFGTARGQNGEILEQFNLGVVPSSSDDDLLLIEPGVAAAYERTLEEQRRAHQTRQDATKHEPPELEPGAVPRRPPPEEKTEQKPADAAAHSFVGTVEVNPTTAKVKLVTIAEEIIALLTSDPNATVKVTLEISAEFPEGASAQTRRAVSENARELGFKIKSWE